MAIQQKPAPKVVKKSAKELPKRGVGKIEKAEDARILSEAGFRDVEMFYAAFTWRGWVGYA